MKSLLMLRKVMLIVYLFVLPFSVSAEDIGTPDIDEIEYPDDEEPSAELIDLGKVLFFDNRLSINRKQSCATCHNPDLGFSDGLAKSIGTLGNKVDRNTPHLYNLAWASVLFWDGRSGTLEEQALGPIQAAGEMSMSLPEMVKRLNAVDYYRETFAEIFGDSGISSQNIALAIASFERTIVSNNSSFDKYFAGDNTAMSPSAIRGLKLFTGKANCTTCHDGVNFTDDSFHNIGIPDADVGRFGIDNTVNMKGAFKTPGLRNIVFSAPYMHDGSIGSLEDVVSFYNRGGDDKSNLDKLIKPLNLDDQEMADIVAFLGALTDPVSIERPQIP